MRRSVGPSIESYVDKVAVRFGEAPSVLSQSSTDPRPERKEFEFLSEL